MQIWPVIAVDLILIPGQVHLILNWNRSNRIYGLHLPRCFCDFLTKWCSWQVWIWDTGISIAQFTGYFGFSDIWFCISKLTLPLFWLFTPFCLCDFMLNVFYSRGSWKRKCILFEELNQVQEENAQFKIWSCMWTFSPDLHEEKKNLNN